MTSSGRSCWIQWPQPVHVAVAVEGAGHAGTFELPGVHLQVVLGEPGRRPAAGEPVAQRCAGADEVRAGRIGAGHGLGGQRRVAAREPAPYVGTDRRRGLSPAADGPGERRGRLREADPRSGHPGPRRLASRRCGHDLYLAMDSGHDQLAGPPGPAVLATQLLGRTRRNVTLDDSMSLQFTGIASSSAGAGPVTGRIRASARELLGGVRHAAGSPSFLRADGIFRGQYLVLRGLAGITFRPAGH